ncbi:MAG: GspH/FimT family pseudopilin [Methylococcales bacterium]|nr:GspH/FimT family pseudopilin [Methylococcales bacterium]
MNNFYKKTKGHKGFTIIELLITVSILGILASMGLPGFLETINSTRLTTKANELVASLNFARSEAIKRNTAVYVANTSNSDKRNWKGGWVIFIDNNGNETFNKNTDILLKEYPALESGYSLRVGGNIENWLAYKPTGLYTTSTGRLNDSFQLCTMDKDKKSSRKITLNSIGRTRITKNNVSKCV